MAKFLLVGFGVSNQSVARALVDRQSEVRAYDANPGRSASQATQELNLELGSELGSLAGWLEWCDYAIPTPGLPDAHPFYGLLADAGAQDKVLSELDVFAAHDSRPYLAITGTNGKTTVTHLVTDMLQASGVSAVAAGNADPVGVPLCDVLGDAEPEVVVVETSSFQLRHARAFAPQVAAWLNFAPDHLDVHASLDAYEACKAKLWQRLEEDSVAVANWDDPVVRRHVPPQAKVVSVSGGIGLGGAGSGGAGSEDAGVDFAVLDGSLAAFGEPFLALADLPRCLPHDLFNALAATAVATAGSAAGSAAGGAAESTVLPAAAGVLRSFTGLPHRLNLVKTYQGVGWYDDSKATTPQAVLSALAGFESVVLIAGGRNKGLDLQPLATATSKLRAVVLIGEATAELQAVLANTEAPRLAADNMKTAVQLASEAAQPGDVVLLSPGCVSFDWYGSYKERGQDFIACVEELLS